MLSFLIDNVAADLWVVQRQTKGPFAELSRVPRTLRDRVAAVPGVRRASECLYFPVQRRHSGKDLRMSIFGLDWPADNGEWLPLIAGRPLQQNHYEMIADRLVGLSWANESPSPKTPTQWSVSPAAWRLRPEMVSGSLPPMMPGSFRTMSRPKGCVWSVPHALPVPVEMTSAERSRNSSPCSRPAVADSRS